LLLGCCSAALQNAALQAHRVTMYSQMQHLRQQLHLDVHRQHRRLQQLLQEQQLLQQKGQDAALDTQICPVKQQMAVVLGGVDDTVRNSSCCCAAPPTWSGTAHTGYLQAASAQA
jgi:hypothetical protein